MKSERRDIYMSIDKFMSLQGKVYIDDQFIGNVPVFRIKNNKFVLGLENFYKDCLANIFCLEYDRIIFELSPKERTLKLEGINTAHSLQKMTFETVIVFDGFDNLNLIDDSITTLVLYGRIISSIGLTYGEEPVTDTKRSSTVYKEDRDLLRINKDLFQIVSANTIINKHYVTAIDSVVQHESRVDRTAIHIMSSLQPVIVREPLEQVIKFFKGYDYAEDKPSKALSDRLNTLIQHFESEKLAKYLD